MGNNYITAEEGGRGERYDKTLSGHVALAHVVGHVTDHVT